MSAPGYARKIAADAFIYGFPLVEGYKTLYAQAVDGDGPDFKASFNRIVHSANVFTPDDKVIITPNSDTPYSFVWMDLRAEPVVLTLPKIDPKRYYSVQLIDLYTYNFAYLGRRTSGSSGGHFMIAGPGWEGPTPRGVERVIPCETQLAYALYRTQLFDAADIDAVRKVQAGYQVQTLSAFLGGPTMTAAPPPIQWPKPQADMLETPALFRYLNFLLTFCPTHPSETELMRSFVEVGVGAGMPFDETRLSDARRAALVGGIADGAEIFASFKRTDIDTHKITSADFFGTRAHLKNNYLYRFCGARLGIYGNSGEEAEYVGGFVDAQGQPLDGSKHEYALQFAAGQLPPTDAFWSLTMYSGKDQFLVANPLQRYLINSSMESQLKHDADGTVTLYVQAQSPGRDKESNWLPAPNGPFYTVLRMYQPRAQILNGKWQAPRLQQRSALAKS
jgi:hypothetical protein